MKNIYPNQLIQRPSAGAPIAQDIRIGDLVALQPSDSTTPVVSKVIMVVPLEGTTTYTSEALGDTATAGKAHAPTRYRFRHRDIHHLMKN